MIQRVLYLQHLKTDNIEWEEFSEPTRTMIEDLSDEIVEPKQVSLKSTQMQKTTNCNYQVFLANSKPSAHTYVASESPVLMTNGNLDDSKMYKEY